MLTIAQCREEGPDPQALFSHALGYDKIALAVSGGSDSLALLLLYAAWRAENAAVPDAVVYSVDHGLRPEAADEAAMVVSVATRLGIGARILNWIGSKPDSGTQEKARAARYGLMFSAMVEDGAQVLLTAHHIEDQAETVLMRLAHGSGITGLGGMRPIQDGGDMPVLRPLLNVSKAQLARLVDRASLSAAADPSNDDLSYERVRWRNVLQQLGQTGLTASRLAEFAQRARRMDDLATGLVEEFQALHQIGPDALGVVRVSVNALRSAHDEIAIRVVAQAIEVASGRPSYRLAQVEQLWGGLREALHNGAAFAKRTLGGACVALHGGAVCFFRDAGRMDAQTQMLRPSHPVIWDNRFAITLFEGEAEVTFAGSVTRRLYRQLMGHAPNLPVAALRAAPLITGRDGEILALGAHVISQPEKLSVRRLTLT